MSIWIPVFGFLLGANLGSFLNVCIDRLPQGQSLVYPPSHCAACGRKLRTSDLIPLVSYLWLRGRCRYCGVPITGRILAVELLTALLFAFLSFSYGFGIEFAILAFYSSILLVLAVIDLEHCLILNKITYPAIGLSLLIAPFWSSLGFSRVFLGQETALYSFLNSLLGGVVFVVPLLLIAMLYSRGLGWGDVKMAALGGLVTGFPQALVAMSVAFIGGGILAGFLLLLRLRRFGEGIPFGPLLAFGIFIALLWGEDIIDWYMNFFG
ncbi:MAG: prepilin peptidase [Chloroflexi bacterium]|nr:prepilin peptidase [Chloroflexota bacterium]